MKTYSLPLILLFIIFSNVYCDSTNITNNNTTLIICNDTSSNCNYLVNIGKCIKNPSYMEEYCKKSCDFCNNTRYKKSMYSVYQTIFAVIFFLLCIGCISYWTDQYETNKAIQIKRKIDRNRARDMDFHRKLNINNPIYPYL